MYPKIASDPLNHERIQFGYICPIPYLKQFVPDKARFHLCLAHLTKDPEYCKFYRRKRERGDTIVMDNSAFEFGAAIDAKALVKLVVESGIQPQVIVAPDYPGQPSYKTVDSLRKFCDLLPVETQAMGVPQSTIGNWSAWVQCYEDMCSMARYNDRIAMIGMSILGIPNGAQGETGRKDIAYNRIWGTAFLISRKLIDPRVWHHYLGCGTPSEIAIQAQLNVADSLDSSSPIWHGLHGIKYDDSPSGLLQGKSKIPVNFAASITFTDDQDDHPLPEPLPEITPYREECVARNSDWIEANTKRPLYYRDRSYPTVG